MKTTSLAMIFIAFMMSSTGQSVLAQDRLVLKAATVHLGDGSVISPGQVVVKDGKIVKVGKAVPAGDASEDSATVIEVGHLMPGLVDAASRTGVAELDAELTREITPQLSTVDIVDWTDRSFQEQVASGTTTLHLTPGTDNVVCGLAGVVKTAGNTQSLKSARQRIVSESTGLMIAVCSDPASGNRARSRPDSIYVRQPTNRMGVVWMLRATFNASENRTNDSANVKSALAGQLPVFSVSRTQYDIQTLLTLAKEFHFEPIVIGGQESWQVLDELAQANVPVILQPTDPGSPIGTERTRISANLSHRLSEAGVTFCFSGGQLLNQARFAVRNGLSSQNALKAITKTPAALLKIDDKVGSIAVGKDADFVALNGDPLEFTTAISWVMVNGKIQYQEAGN